MERRSGQRVAPFAMFVDLQDEPIAVIGAGSVAARKIRTLVDHGARVSVVAPAAANDVRALADAGHIIWTRRCYESGDLQGFSLAFVATDDRQANEAAYAEARSLHIPVNVVDVPELCTFVVPSVMKRGQLQVAVSTNGAAPSVAREIRRDLEARFPAWWGEYIDLLGEVRALVKARVPGDASVRAPLFEALGASGIEARVAAGEQLSAEAVYVEVVVPLLEEGAR